MSRIRGVSWCKLPYFHPKSSTTKHHVHATAWISAVLVAYWGPRYHWHINYAFNAYPLDDREIPMILTIDLFFSGHVRRRTARPILTYPRPMVSHMDLDYVLQRLVRCLLAVFVALDVTPQWTQMANARDVPIGITHFGVVFCSLMYQYPAQTNRHMGTLWGLLHHPNQKTGGAWGFSWFY
jgi:hypothetical protein